MPLAEAIREVFEERMVKLWTSEDKIIWADGEEHI